MSGEVIVFTIISAMILFGALGVVSTKNVGHATLYLLITLHYRIMEEQLNIIMGPMEVNHLNFLLSIVQ